MSFMLRRAGQRVRFSAAGCWSLLFTTKYGGRCFSVVAENGDDTGTSGIADQQAQSQRMGF
jgi:hypothetical protein